MTSHRPMDDARVERLLRRRGLGASADHDPAGAFVAAIADLGRHNPEPTGALAVLLTDGFEPASDPMPPPVGQGPRRRRWLAELPLRVKVLAGAGVALMSLTTAATAGILPGPVQDGVGGVLEAVTPFDFPAGPEPTTPIRTPEQGVPGADTETPVAPDPVPATIDPLAPVDAPTPPAVPVPVPVPVVPTDEASTPPDQPQAPRSGTEPPAPRPDAPRPDSPRPDAPRGGQRPPGAIGPDLRNEPGYGGSAGRSSG